MRVRVLLFAGLRERAGTPHVDVELAAPVPTVAELRDALATTTPLGDLARRGCIVAVDREYAREDRRIDAGSELALIPPVSGGADECVRHVALRAEPLDPAAIRARVTDPRAGAVVVFEGVTREVDHLDYEAYPPMAERLLHEIAAEAAARHHLLAVALEHRVGRVGRSEPSVVVAVASAHRGAAFAGARAILDALKERAPIFKREAGAWVEGALPAPGSPD